MRSSTSSSNDRLPTGGWPRTWAVALLLALSPLAGWEAFWRASGYRPNVQAEDEAWVLAFRRIPNATTVVLGTSRIQAVLDPEPFREVLGGTAPVNLALPEGSPLPILEFLADSTSYARLLIVELLPLYAFDGNAGQSRQSVQLLARYRRMRSSPASLAEAYLRVYGMWFLVFRSPQLLPTRLITTLRTGGRPWPNGRHMRPNRFAPVAQRSLLAVRAWSRQTGLQGLTYPHTTRFGRPATDAEFATLTARIDRAVNRIIDRGGQVVLVNLAACGERGDIERARYPRARYWDRLAQQTRAIALTSEDYPSLSRFDCWDGSHIEAQDAPAYARALATIMREAGARPRL